MANLIAHQSGIFTGSIWKPVSAVTNAFVDSVANNTALTTSPVASAAFVPTAAVNILGVSLRAASRAVTPSGTMTVELYNATTASVAASVTVNVSDLPYATQTLRFWMHFQFAAPVTPNGTDSFTIRAYTSAAAQVNLFRDATAGNWSRLVKIDSALQAPAASDWCYIQGAFTGAGTSSAIDVVMDSTSSATIYGQVAVGANASLKYGTAASSNYHLKLNRDLIVDSGATFFIGDSATPIPATSTATLEFSLSANVAFGFNAYGASVVKARHAESSLRTPSVKMSADIAAGATTIPLELNPNWKSGDTIVVPDTTVNYNQYEVETLASATTGSSCTITAGITNAHLADAEIINLTRPISILGTSTSFQTFVTFAGQSIVDMQGVLFRYMGSATASKRGIEFQGNHNSSYPVTFKYNVLRDFSVASSIGLYLTGPAYNYMDFDYVVGYNCVTFMNFPATAGLGDNNTFKNSTFIRNITATACTILDQSWRLENFAVWNAALTGIVLTYATESAEGIVWDNVRLMYNASTGLSMTTVNDLQINNLKCVRNYTTNLQINGCKNLTFNSPIIKWSAQYTIYFITADTFGLEFNDGEFASTTLSAMPQAMYGVFNSACNVYEAKFNNCTFANFTNADIHCGNNGTFDAILQYTLINCTLGSATQVASNAFNLHPKFGFVKAQKLSAGNHKAWFGSGTYQTDTTIFRTASPSVRIVPNNASVKIEGPKKHIALNSGAAATVRAYVRKSVAGDGTAYNGSQVRMILKKDHSVGVAADTVLATSTAASDGAWEQLTGSLPAITDHAAYTVVIDCDGTAGWVNIDDWIVE
jgi:hypothetical protein